jgi:hypothetical protein
MTSTEASRYQRQSKGLSKSQRARAKVRAYGAAALSGSAAAADKSMLKSASRYSAKNAARKNSRAGRGGGGRGRQRRDRNGKFA